MHVTGTSKREERETGAGNIFDEIMTKKYHRFDEKHQCLVSSKNLIET